MRLALANTCLFLSCLVTANAATLGNPAINRPLDDTANGVTYVWLQSFSSTAYGESLATWSFFDNDNFSPDRQVTPLLFEQVGPKLFILRGVGETRTTTEAGLQTFSFSLQEGTATILNSAFLFGWKDGSPTTHNQGVIDWDSDGPVSIIGGENNVDLPAVGGTLDFSVKEYRARTYSFQVTTVPEPSISILAIFGLGTATFSRRRRKA